MARTHPPQWRSIICGTNQKICTIKQRRESEKQRHVCDEKEKEKREVEVDLDKLVAKKNLKESAIFDFLGLPRELRDQVYEYILRPANVDTERRDEGDENTHALYDSIYTHASQHLALSSPPPLNPLTSLLLVNRKIHAELLPLLYKSALFTVHMDRSTPVFAPRHFITTAPAGAVDCRYTFGPGCVSTTEDFHGHTEVEIRAEERQAIPFGWDVRYITSMVLRIDLGHENCAGVGTMPDFAWPALSQMRSLKKLCLVVTHFQRPWERQSATAIYSVNADQGAGTGSPEFRNMLGALFSHLPTGILELEFGAPGGHMRCHFPMLAYLHPELGGGGAWVKRTVESLSAFIEWKVKAVEQNRETGREIRTAVAGVDRDVRYQHSRLYS